MTRQVWVTGMGIACPLGCDLETVARGQREGRSGAEALAGSFDTTGLPILAAFRVPGWDRGAPDLRSEFGLHAARQALVDAFGGLAIPADPARVGVHMGSGLVSTLAPETEQEILCCLDGQGRYVHAKAALRLRQPSPYRERHLTDRVNRGIALWTGQRGPSLANHGACAASAIAIGLGARWIERGLCDVVIAGGAESMIHPLGVLSFQVLGALSERQDCAPSEVSRPFDVTRDGFVIAEGGAALVLEEAGRARARGARCWGRVLGMGTSMDAHRVTAPPEDGRGAQAAMRGALRAASLAPSDIGWINAHGTGTPLNDPAETAAIKAVFGGRGQAPPVSSSKGAVGHAVAAAGAVEAVLSLLARRDGILAPTLNLHRPDPLCDLDYVPLEARPLRVRHLLSNSFGFGGVNCSLALGGPQ